MKEKRCIKCLNKFPATEEYFTKSNRTYDKLEAQCKSVKVYIQ